MNKLLFILLSLLALQCYSTEHLHSEERLVVAVGSTNKVKLDAVKVVFQDYPILDEAIIHSYKVPTEVAEQPLSMNETIRGAKNRAKNAFEECGNCRYSIGIESGLMKVEESKSGFMEFTACCIYDGKEFYLGQSSAYEMPENIIDLVVNGKMNMAEACYQSGLTNDTKLGEKEGDIGILSKGRMTRQDQSEQALVVALIQIENFKLYSTSRKATKVNKFSHCIIRN